MFTIIAWVVFIPAFVWNLAGMVIVIDDLLGAGKIKWNARDFLELAFSLALLFVPGVYLFGWF